jgi:hypothetical protein
MATATYTSTVFGAPPKALHSGDQSVSGAMFWTAASTVGDIGFLAKVPHGAKIVDFQEWHSTGATAQGLSFGFDRGIAAGGAGNASILIASGAQATSNRMTMAGMPITISLSDLDPVRYAILVAKVESGTTTTSLNVAFRLTYRMDGPDPV